MANVVEAMPGFKFGCDPELFIMGPEGEYVSPDGIIPGTKSDPYKVPRGALQQDGMAAEFNIDPVDNFDDFKRNISSVLTSMRKMLPPGHTLVATPAVTFSEKEWEKASDIAKQLGCSPDFNAWTGKVNPPPNDPENPRLRTASGHLHIGWTEDADMGDTTHLTNCKDLVKQLDWYLGAWSVSLDPDPTRRRLYGKAGACRFKDYGVEYRVLSNFWVGKSVMTRHVWNRLQTAIWEMRNQYLPEQSTLSGMYDFNSLVVESINESKHSSVLADNFYFPTVSL